jgi:RNA-directed DNA polymerase
MAAILVAIERHPAFVFAADIEKAFDHLNQAVILDKLQTYPALREAINAWLKAGVVDGGTFFPSETGIPQGGALSPLLMNVALHGMETAVTEGTARAWPLLVRYADNFVIAHPDLKALQQAVRHVARWLATLGLQLNERKTRLTHTLTPHQGQVGFDFLGFSLRQGSLEKQAKGKRDREHALSVKTIITPSQEADKRHLAAIDQRLQHAQTASQARVIAELNPLILGWVAYYNGLVEAAVLSRYDELIEQRLLDWASKQHPGKARDWLLARYWQRVGSQLRVFATPDGLQLRAYQQTGFLEKPFARESRKVSYD